ncbi:Similar to hypothetical protein [Tuber melanosporum Mel28]; acc. no. XP_002840438 [Pyronema omphalodes CBS 100304]|uniref:Uncharacterized protein n=1 Tax=Pyronema omphalodes (strain CBS 100304) TaxID=1076935 RepID=U4LJB8_PYROM|nr:Similar to hypothetical protein [Tuber melanosporum Mel28]; acc. no. XP_002840438 [Pyronema omphalodes CBS 100304]
MSEAQTRPNNPDKTSNRLSISLASIRSQHLVVPGSSADPPHPPPNPPRPRRATAGGFLLDSTSSLRSLARSTSLRSRNVSGSTATTATAVGPASGTSEADDDPAAMVDLVLQQSAQRKDTRPTSQGKSIHAPPSRHTQSSGGSGSKRFSSSFLMGGMGRAHTSAGTKESSSKKFLSPVEPPSTPGRPVFPGHLSPQLPWGGTQQPEGFQHQMKKRWSLGKDQLKELQQTYKFSEATMQRTIKAKQALELSAHFRTLLEIEATGMQGTGKSKEKELPERFYEYNPLRVIRNRRLRNRKKIMLDVSPWENPGEVHEWVMEVEESMRPPGKDTAGGLPLPPAGTGKKLKRPKMDWIIPPEEMLADYYWMRCEEYKRDEMEGKKKKRRSLQSVDSEKPRMSLDVPSHDLSFTTMASEEHDIPKRSRTTRRRKGYQKYEEEEPGYESTATSSSDSGGSSDDYMNHGSSSSEDDNPNPNESPNHHRRRRKIKRLIARHGTKKLKKQQLEQEEKRRKQEAEMYWVKSESEGDMQPTPVPHANYEQPEYRKSFELEDGWESAATGRSPIKPSHPFFTMHHGGSRSSFEFDGGFNGGLGISGLAAADNAVPSIAISFSPPRVHSANADERDDDIREFRAKNFFNKRRDGTKAEESGRESLDIDRAYTRPEKDRSSKIGRVKSRVDKLRNEVAKVEDLVPWKNRSNAPSPTASIHTASDSEDNRMLSLSFSREGTMSASEREDLKSPIKPSSAKKPSPSKPSKSSKPPHRPGHRSRYSTGTIPFTSRVSFDSEREASPDRRSSRLRETTIRSHSPIGAVDISSVSRNPDKDKHHPTHQIITHLDPPQHFSDAPEEPCKATPPLSPSLINHRIELKRERARLLSSGIVARQLAARGLDRNKCFTVFNTATNQLDSLLSTYDKRQSLFITQTAPAYHARIAAVSSNVQDHLTPLVRGVADEADELSITVTTELTLEVKKLQEEIFKLARKRRNRGKMRLLVRIMSMVVEWAVRVVLWGVWCVVLGMRVVRTVVGVVVSVGRWVLWL